jgi:hypothetical protein
VCVAEEMTQQCILQSLGCKQTLLLLGSSSLTRIGNQGRRGRAWSPYADLFRPPRIPACDSMRPDVATAPTCSDICCPQGAARNCLLVKGGSSFNALVRAMKQDLIDSGTAAEDPAILYQIDKVGCGNRLH